MLRSLKMMTLSIEMSMKPSTRGENSLVEGSAAGRPLLLSETCSLNLCQGYCSSSSVGLCLGSH